MKFLANYIMRGPLQAILVASVTALLGLLLPPLSYLSGAVVGLVALRLGARETVKVIAGACAATAGLGLLLVHNPLLPLAFLLAMWGPAFAAAYALRRSVRLERSLLVAVLFGSVVVFGLHASIDVPAEWWRSFLQHMAGQGSAEQQAALAPMLDDAAKLMTGLVAAAVAFGIMVSLLLARWWQALLYNPGGFREEFHRLRFGKAVAVVAVVLLAVAWQAPPGLEVVADLLPLALLLQLLQGIALVHGLVARKGANRGWLVAMYLLLGLPMVAMQTALTLAVAGLVDNWMDFRTFFGTSDRTQ